MKKPWGDFQQFTLNEQSTVKILHIRAGQRFSLQSHQHRREHWYVVAGSGTAELDGQTIALNPGVELEIPVGSSHRIAASHDTDLAVLEVSVGDFDEQDIVRYSDDYGRV